MKLFGRHLPYLKFLWMLMAVHILLLESEFPEVFEDDGTPVAYTLSEKKSITKTSFLGKIFVEKKKSIQTGQIQEDIFESPDYVPLGLKISNPKIPFVFIPAEMAISHIEVLKIQFDPESLSPPPRPYVIS